MGWQWGAILRRRPAKRGRHLHHSRLSLPVLPGACLGAVSEVGTGQCVRRAPRVAHAAGAPGRHPPFGLPATAVRLLLPRLLLLRLLLLPVLQSLGLPQPQPLPLRQRRLPALRLQLAVQRHRGRLLLLPTEGRGVPPKGGGVQGSSPGRRGGQADGVAAALRPLQLLLRHLAHVRCQPRHWDGGALAPALPPAIEAAGPEASTYRCGPLPKRKRAEVNVRLLRLLLLLVMVVVEVVLVVFMLLQHMLLLLLLLLLLKHLVVMVVVVLLLRGGRASRRLTG